MPEKLSRNVLETIHEDSHGGVSAMEKLVDKIGLKIKNVRSIASEVTGNCKACRISKSAVSKKLGSLPKGGTTLQTLSIDVCEIGGKLPKILTVCDLNSRFVQAYLIMAETSEFIIEKLVTFFRAFEYPKRILSYNHAAYLSARFRDFAKAFGISLVKTPVYRPKANGVVERIHRTILDGLRALCTAYELQELEQTVLDELLTRVVLRVNMTCGRVPAWDEVLSFEGNVNFIVYPAKDQNFQASYEIGQEVLMKDRYRSHKLLPLFGKPAKITRVLGNHRYEVDLNGHESIYTIVTSCEEIRSSVRLVYFVCISRIV